MIRAILTLTLSFAESVKKQIERLEKEEMIEGEEEKESEKEQDIAVS